MLPMPKDCDHKAQLCAFSKGATTVMLGTRTGGKTLPSQAKRLYLPPANALQAGRYLLLTLLNSQA